MELKHVTDRKFLAWLTLALILVSLWVFKSYLDYLIVAAVLALALMNNRLEMSKLAEKFIYTTFRDKARQTPGMDSFAFKPPIPHRQMSLF
jgi:hypothetical protein